MMWRADVSWTLMVLLLSTGWHRIHGKTVQARRMHFTFQRGRRLEAMNRIRDPKKGLEMKMLPLIPWQGIHSQIMIQHMRSQREKTLIM